MRDEKNERLGRGKGTSGSIQGHRSVRVGRLGVVAVALALVAAAAFAVPAFATGGSLGDFGSAVASFLGFAPRAEAAEKEVVTDPSTLDNWKGTLDTTTKNVGRIWTDKSVSTTELSHVTKDPGADFLVGLSALSSASNLMTEKTQPLDIVLVLDTSDSMVDENVMGSVYDPVYDLDPYGTYFILGPDNRYLYVEPYEPGVTWSYKAADDTIVKVKPKRAESDTDGVQFYQETQIKKLEALKTVVSELIDSIARKNVSVENPEKYDRIAIERFATAPSVPSGFTDVAGEDNINDLKDSVEQLAANGTTNTKTAFQRLSDLLESARSDAKKVVIFFTDGEPSITSSGFDSVIAADTVDYANTIKAAGTTIYSVGVFHDANPTDTEQNFNKFMHAVSSNYPDATCGASGNFDSLDLGDRADGSFYLSAKNSDELSGAFETILTEIQSVDASAPTELPEGTDAGEGGYITFADTLGSYMRVTGDTLSVVYGGGTYTAEKNDDGQFVFGSREVAGNGVYESANLEDLKVTVERNTGSEGDVVTVQIPASLIPCRSYEVTGDGADQSMTISEVEPIRVLFNVSLDSSVTAEALEKALYDESDPLHNYIAHHLSDDNKSVTFLSNLFSGQSVSEDVTVGDTTATFTPSTGNMFYRFTEDTPIYADEDLQTRVAAVDDLDTSGATSYYYPYTYHETSDDGAVESITEAVEFPGSNIVKEGEGKNVAEGNNGAYIMEGSDRVTRIDNINEAKAENATGTASTVLSPIWQDISQRSGNGGLSAIMARLGNNGKVFFKLPGTLEVTKTVDYGNGDKEKLEEKDFSFTFTLELTGSPADKTYAGVITNENDVKTSEVTFSATGGSFTLKDGETLTVKGLVDGMDYTVKETDVPTGFTSSATGEEGTIVANDTVTASFTNTYNAQPAKVSFPVSKELSGRDWRDSDAFTFTLSAEGDVPMPAEGGDTVTIRKDTANHAATFGEISFDEIGTYVYHIKENTTGSTIPGLSYSGATYEVTVEVTDDLAGQLQSEVTITPVQDEGALTVLEGEGSASRTAEFTNTYNYKEGTAVISGTKSYTDHTGGNNIENGKFTFKLVPVDGAPMPQDADGNIVDVVSNVGKSFSFPKITFDGNDVGKTYVYTITEQSGTETGMTYDETAFKAYISVTEANDEDGKAVISAAVTYKMVGENDVETDVEQPKFENEYNADPAKLTLGGTKELAGRDMKETDAFTFCLVPSKETFDSGSVMVGESLITEGGLKQTVSGPAEKGQGVRFSFDELTFTQAGEYTFDLYEEQGSAGGVTYDTEHRTVKVTVTLDKANNKLVASADYGTIGNGEDARPGNEFVNTYEATGTYQGVNVAVKLVGKPMSTGDFGFTITSDDSDALAKLTESDKSFANVTNQDSDVFETMAKLPNMTFDQDDAGKTFVYTVDEIMPVSGDAMPGVDYDESEYILEITAIDNGDGTMSTSTKITQVKDSEGETVSNVIYETTPDGGVENPTIPFINIYTPKPATATLNVTKAVYGKDAIESFSFDLTLSSGDKSSVKVAQDDGSLADFTGAKLATSAGIKAGTTEELTFETLTFTKVGTYVFNVDETTTTDEHGWHYDEATHTITVEVTDENYDGQLDAAVKDDNPTFTNYYADATIGGNTKQPLPVNKIVKAQNVGSDWSTDNDFNFTLTPVTGEGDNETDWSSTSCGTTALRTGITDPFKRGDKKTAHFDEITFYEVGEYHFVVTEDEAQQQEPAGWTYDKSEKEIVVTVTDKDTTDGKLDVTVEGEATFTNTFDPSAVEFTPLPVTKVVKPNDAGLTPAGYQFELSVSNTLEGHEGEGFKLPGSVTSESDDTGKVTFDNITFTQVGTYEVTVKEVVPEDANQEQPGVQDENHITYDQHVFTYTVDVTVGEGTLVASVVESTVTSGADTFTNVYFDPVKEVSGSADDGTLTDGSVAAVGDVLTYTIHWSNNAVDKDGVPTNATVTVTDKVPEHTTYVANSASQGGVYDEQTRTITWTFENQEPGASGTVTYEVTVDESAAQVGAVDNTATVKIGENGPDIDTNTVTTVIPSKDVVAPSDPDTSIDGQLVGVGDKLTYVISYTNPYEEPSTVIITDAVPAGTEFVSADNGGTQSDGKVTWTIEEVPAGESGTVSFTVRVTEDAVDNPGNQVTNEATVKIGDHDPVVTNEVDNVVPEKDVFAAGNTDESIDDQTVSVGDELTYAISYANGEDAAADVTITDSVPAGTEFVSAENGGSEQDGTVTWSLSQVPAGESGTVSFTVRVTEEALEKDAVTNTASVKIGENGPEVKTNTTENPVQTGSLTISKTIELTPDQGTVIDKDQEFQFTVKVLDTAGKPITGTYSGLDFSDEGTASFSLKHGESMTIEGLPAGATYTVTETPVDHYTQTTPADGAPATGTIPADGAAEAAFVNTYKADDSDPTTLELTKVFEGHEWTEGYSFTFVLAGENGAPMPKNNTVTVSGPQPTGEAPIAFGPITYKSVGTYTYTVTETAGENPGIGYDTHTAKVTVEVSDVDGKLTPSVTYEKDVFTNTYDTGTVTVDTSVGLQVVKNMTGRGIMDGDFTFTMAGADDASVARLNDGQPLSFSTSGAALDSASNVASETINVPTGLTFTNEDAGNTYTYTVSENVPEGAVDNELDGVTYDDTVYTVAFAITENGKGTLSVETFVDGESQGVVSAAVATNALPAQLVFDNSYDAGEASVDVSATKVLKNHELTDGMFTFDVYNDSVAEGGEARHVLSASNASDGSVALGTLSYTTAGLNADVAAGYATRTAGEGRSATYVYGYTVHEAAVEGVTNNTGDLHFTVTVTDDGTGHLTAEATLPEGDLVFHNTYGTTESANLSISGVKVLRVEGDNLTPPDITGKYAFTITGVDEQGNELPADLLPEQTQVNNQESGTVDFGSVSYTMASVFGDTGAAAEDGTETASLEPRQRTFTYTITESGEVPGVVNDPEPTRTIAVTVTDNGDGTISVAKASDEASDQPGTDFVFTNVYRVRPATSTPTGDGGFNFNKSLVSPFDRPLLEGEFTFQMTDGEGNVVSEATNAADGTISMPAIEFGAPGDYAYTLAEVAGDEDGITYDTRTYTVTAHVADKGDGTLGVTWSVDGVEPGGTLTFTNEYAPAPTSITLGARKVLEGRELRAGEFTFQILEGNVVVSTGTNAADGSVEFEPIVYDAPGEHDYTIVEVAGSDAGVTYDDTVYTVHVSVTNNVEANRLETSWSYGEAGQPVFHNSFVEPPEEEPDEPHDEPDRPSDEPSDGPSGEPSGEPPLPAAGDPIRAMPVVAVALAGCVAAIISALRLRRQR